MSKIAELAGRLDEAALTASAVARPDEDAGWTVDDAYLVQEALIDLRLARGERFTGVKMGFTSVAKMRQMGVDELIWGRLTDAMRIEDGGTLEFGRHVHPRAEPEVAFRLSRAPRADEPMSSLVSAIDAVAPAIEIIDSRYRNFRFSLTDVIADNASSAGFVLGPWRPAAEALPGLAALGVRLEVDGVPVETGSTAAILDDPLHSLAAAVRLTSRYGLPLGPGDVVLAGAATAAVPLDPGTRVEAVVEGLGSARFHVSERPS